MKREYKVGDTVYVKGKIIQADESHGKFPYCVSFSDSDFTRIIDMCHAWLDEDSFVEPPAKPTLPKEVADELEDAKKTFHDFYAYLDSADRIWQPKTYTYVFSSDTNRDAKIKILSDAWYNGYTVEKEPTWYIEVPGKFNRPTYYAINDGALAFGYFDEDKKWYHDYSAHAFTDEEIKKYDLENFDKELVTDDDED
ncbi:DUF1642 domain-containing protein [Lapidilactobacillus bayanensis]|uniref:DUF1642 domain-containing protein n=1 Tax=Lapidilactobacillus bayanensis TaxID=2485998 RepID=UPI000F79A308|nr:DUF1642 domain-containing protein [Lapidilactobacillus bayanensis]